MNRMYCNKYLEVGMDGYLSKPINTEELYRVVEEFAIAEQRHKETPIKEEGSSPALPAVPRAERVDVYDCENLNDIKGAEDINKDVAGMLKTLGGDKGTSGRNGCVIAGGCFRGSGATPETVV